MALEDKPFGDKPKDYRVTEKGTIESDVLSKERLNEKKGPNPSLLVVGPVGLAPPITGHGGPVSDAAAATVAAVVNEDWVCCDKCEKWRLLPPGVNPGSLPEKWLCSMLDWLYWVSDHDGAIFNKKVNTFICDFPSRKDHQKYVDHSKNPKSALEGLGINPKNPNGTLHERDLVKKRKSNEFEADIEDESENRRRKGKKVKLPESQEEEKDRFLADTSSSSKVSSSHKTKANNHEAKGSPVESVSSSPLRILNPDKLTSSSRNVEGVDNSQDPKKDQDDDRGNYGSNVFKKELDVAESLDKVIPSLESESLGAKPSFQRERKNDDQSHSNGSRARKNGKGSSSRSKDKNRGSKDIKKINLKTSEQMTESSDTPLYDEKSKGRQNRSQDKADNNPSVNPDKFEKGSALKKESSGKPVSIHDVKQNDMPIECGNEKISKRDVSGKGKPHSLLLPPSGKSQNESTRPSQPLVGSQKENVGNSLSVDGVEGSDAPTTVKQKKKNENQNGNQLVSIRHHTPNRHKGTPSPLRRESSSQAASAIKEAKALKHMADRLKNLGSNHESNSLYCQAALKFLYGSSLLESFYIESGKHGDMIQSMGMYSGTAKLCEYVAHEYEKLKEVAAAALAYKLAEVAYLKVVYSSYTSASKDRQELQTSLQIGPTGESPSSSASDIDNLNNPAAVDKNALTKGANDPQIGGNHVIAARIKPNFLRILNFAQDVNFAMEASRRSQLAFAACGPQPEHGHHKEVIKQLLISIFKMLKDCYNSYGLQWK